MSGLSLQEPHVVATLPRPVDASEGTYICAVVHGSEPGSRKRKRKREIAVGIHGESINLYDTSTPRLITSYALPPRSTLQSICSIKSKVSKTTGFQRKTYIAATESSNTRINLFKDVTDGEGNTESIIAKYELETSTSPIIFLDTVAGIEGCDLLAVRADGAVFCLDGTNLRPRWQAPSSSISQGSSVNSTEELHVDYCQVTDAYSASQGLFDGRPDILASFPEPIVQNGYNPDLLVMIITSAIGRSMNVLQLPLATQSSNISRRSLQTIHSISLNTTAAMNFDLHTTSGTLYTMETQKLNIYDLKTGVAKRRSSIGLPERGTFLRLTSTSVVACSANEVKIYNPKYASVQAFAKLSKTAINGKRKANEMSQDYQSCQFINYNHSQSTIYAIRDIQLLAFQVDIRQNGGSSRDVGSLIHAIGHGQDTLRKDLQPSDKAKIVGLDKFARVDDVANFERMMADVLNMRREVVADSTIPDWIWPSRRDEFKHVSEFWTRYAISKVFTWTRGTSTDAPFELRIHFYPHNVVRWLLETGSLTKTNVEAALRGDLLLSGVEEIPTGQLIAALVEVDPLMNALSSYLSNTLVDALELAHGVRALMQSLELFSVSTPARVPALTNGDAEADLAVEIEEEETAADNELVIADYHLGDGSSIRGQALSVAIAKLHKKPAQDIISALKATFSSAELIAFIYLLRFELARGSWTTRYLDLDQAADDDDDVDVEETANHRQDSNIILVTDLLNNCIDAFGSGGWLASNGAPLSSTDANESEELIKGLSLEISAALQGIEESAFLKGFLVEMLRYAEAVQSQTQGGGAPAFLGSHAVTKTKVERPIVVPGNARDAALLPFGLKVSEKIALGKVGAGGEVTRRTARDIGRLKSRKVMKYSRERIVI